MRLRTVVDVNPATLEFARARFDTDVTFLPLEAVWPSGRLHVSRVRPKGEVDTGYTRFREGVVLVPKITPTFEAGRSTVALGLKNGVGAGTTELHVLRPKGGVDARLVCYLTQSSAFLAAGKAAMTGVAGQQRVPDYFVGQFPVQVEVVENQRMIADFLDAETARIDDLVRLRRSQLALLNKRVDSARSQLVLKGLNPMTGVGCAQPDWRIAKLGILLTLQRGHDLPLEARRTGSVPVVSSGGVSGWHDVGACRPPGVVTGRYGTVGQVFYIDVPYWPLNTTLYVSDFKGNEPRWAKELLACLPLDAESEKSAVGGINRNNVGDLRVPVPNKADQRQIAVTVDAVQQRIERASGALLRQVSLLQEHRQALITAAVTGQLDHAREIAEVAS